jgi:hypothetical protein
VIETGKTFSINKKYYNSYFHEHWPKESQLVFEDDDSFWVPLIGKDEKTGEMKT